MKNKLQDNKRIILVLICLLIPLLIISFYKILNPYYTTIHDSKYFLKKVDEHKDYDILYNVRVQGTNIDTPVLYDNGEIELEKIDFNFLWINSKINRVEDRLLIFGHNVRNLSSVPQVNREEFMWFEDLAAFIYYDFAKKNKYIELTTESGTYLYKIFAVRFVEQEDVEYFKYRFKDGEFSKYISTAKAQSLFSYDVDIKEGDKLLSLNTCTRFFGQSYNRDIQIDARKVRKNELISNYGVKKNKKYESIEKIMKGDQDEGEV